MQIIINQIVEIKFVKVIIDKIIKINKNRINIIKVNK
jgi:hypothetical protein